MKKSWHSMIPVFQIVLILFILSYTADCAAVDGSRNFYIDYKNNTFVRDSQPFQYVSGSIHPYRVPNELWEDRLTKMWAGGLNAIQIYIFWNEHEPSPGVYDFDGQNDIFRFLDIAQKIGFVVVLRPGPYICGEHDFGGLPWWLLSNGTDSIILRSSENTYMNAVRRWYSVLFPKLAPYLYKNGGPIITVQVENEYGSYYTCDKAYTGELRDLSIKYFGSDVVLFTTDPPHLIGLDCGSVSGVYTTVDFGVSTDPGDAFRHMRLFSPRGPLVNSEFYPGWLDFWGVAHQKVSTNDVLKSFDAMMKFKANVNFYMYHGGTNFGFSNGADPPYEAQPTSYDYDAPLSEAGDITNKFLAVRKAISAYLPVPQVPIPQNSTKLGLGKVPLTYHVSLVDAIAEFSSSCYRTQVPQSFERLGQGYGFIMYTVILSDPNVDGKVLSIPGVRDRAYVQIGSRSVGVLYRVLQTSLTIRLPGNTNTTMFIIVENMGRLNFGNDFADTKGIISDVFLDGKRLTNWMTCLTDNFIPYYQKKLKDSDFVSYLTRKENLLSNKNTDDIDFKTPAIYIGEFSVPGEDFDTFLKMDKFQKGLGFIRSNTTLTNLGRYWPNTGPQVTLYTPGVFLTQQANNYLVLIEFEGSNCQSASNCYAEFIDYPIIDSIPSK